MPSIERRLEMLEDAAPKPLLRAYLMLGDETEEQARARLRISPDRDALFVHLVPLQGKTP